MRGRDLDPTDGQILHRRTAPNQLQIRSWELNPSPQLSFLASMQRLCMALDSQRSSNFQDGCKTGVRLQTAETPFGLNRSRQKVPYDFRMETPNDRKELRLLRPTLPF